MRERYREREHKKRNAAESISNRADVPWEEISVYTYTKTDNGRKKKEISFLCATQKDRMKHCALHTYM